MRQAHQLEVTPEQAADLRERFSEAAEDGKLYTDAVFEGGGVKGFAFAGALQCFDDHGIHFRKVAGTSAGASPLASANRRLIASRLRSGGA